MPECLEIVLLTVMAGVAIPLGGGLAAVERIQPRWLEQELRHFIIAFGGGVLLAAVSLVLVPEGIKDLSAPLAAFWMLAGGLAFMYTDVVLSRRQGSAAQLIAMLADFIPEALALGAMFAADVRAAPLLALLIALQNFPEGFNAFREMRSSTRASVRTVLIGFCILVPLGPAAGLTGYYWLAGFPVAVDAVMLFAAAGILYLTFQDIAPQARLARHWSPPLGAVGGFLFGLMGHMLLQ